MKSQLHTLGLLLITGTPILNIQAHHLDGLWCNDHQNISLRIETTDEGIKAKRLDQSVWYFYANQEDQFYVDRNGNYYEFLDDDNIIWREAESKKSILFKRSDDRNGSGWNDYGDNYNEWPDNYGNSNWNNHCNEIWDHHRNHSVEGNWYSQNGRHHIQVEDDRRGIRVRRSDGRWMYFEEIDKNEKYRNDQGDIIRLLDDHSLQWKKRRQGITMIFRR